MTMLQSARVDEILEHVNVPSYVIDAAGVIRWLNPAAKKIVGDVEGRQFTSVVAPEDTRRARELFARKVVGTATVTDAGFVLVDSDGDRVRVRSAPCPCVAASTSSACSDRSRTSSRRLTRIRTFP